VGMAWYPGRLNHPSDVISRSASAYGGYLGSSIFQEFQEDIFRMAGKMFGSDRNVPRKESSEVSK
jgi:hypothetical protein